MIGIEVFASAVLAGMIYVLVPGPATLAALSLSATRGRDAAPVVAHPVRAGLTFGLSNPKAYPFALAILTALLGRDAAGLGWVEGIRLLTGCTLGFVLADLIVVFWTGLAPIRRLYSQHAVRLSRAMGVMFVAFGLKAGHDALQAMRGRG